MGLSTAITPVLRYRDASAAAHWLCGAFGFQELNRAQELDGRVRYVSLRLGDSVVLVRPIASSALDDLMVQPEAIGGANTQTCYLTIPDVASHHARAEGAGAKVVIKPQDDGLGGRLYTCRDLEGHLWSFGTRTYGVAQQAASAFEPVELGPSQSSTSIASPERPIAREEKRRRRVRDMAIAAAAGILVSGGWAYYDTFARRALTEEAATSAATAARLGDTVKQLADERRRRLAAEADSTEAATRLAEERTAVTQLRQDAQRASADLADMRRQKEEAARALEAADAQSQKHQQARERAEAQLAAAKVQIAGADAKLARASEETAEAARVQLAKERPSVDAAFKEELQEAKTALIEANRKIEELRAGQLEPMVPDSGGPVAENSPCVLAVQGKIPSSHKGPNTWPAANLSRLCRGAGASAEPARCFEQIVLGRVNWGAGTIWVTANALALCGGTRNARQTLDCFSREVSSSQTWQVAIRQCAAK